MNTITPSKRRSDEHDEKPIERILLLEHRQLPKQVQMPAQSQLLEQKQSPEQKQLPAQKVLPEKEQLSEQLRLPEEVRTKQDQAPERKAVLEEGETHRTAPSPRLLLILAAALIACLIGVVKSYPSINEFLKTETTEDAYVTGHVHQVSSKIAGTVDSVLVKDNELVHKGQVLATIDPRDMQIELAKAEAHLAKVRRDAIAAKHVVVYAARNYSAISENASGSIAQSENAITKAEAGIRAAESDVALAKQKLIERQAELRKANLDLDRYTALAKEGAVKLESLDDARKDHDVALAARDAAVEAVSQANSKLNQAYADLKISKSQLVNANSETLRADAADAQISVNAEQQASSEAAIKEAEADVQNAKLRVRLDCGNYRHSS